MPDRTSPSTGLYFTRLLTRQTIPTAQSPKRKALIVTPLYPNEKNNPRAAPNPAPEDAPRTSGDTMGF
uniref:hypothetical protein n=1 Tax=Clostridium sp. NkU-1 TaxID=1095009 RepID=UPI003260CCFF